MSMTTIRAVKAETPGVTTYDLSFDDPAAGYSFLPGQFNMLYLPGIGESAISMSSDAAEPGKLRHTVRAVGNVTRAMERLLTGDKIGVRGPFGTSWPVEQSRGNDVIVAAGGLGLAPLRPAIYHLIRHRSSYGRVTVLYGARSPADLLYTDEYEAWHSAGLDVQVTVDVGSADWQGSIGFVTTLLSRVPLEPTRTDVFTCGPEVMMRFIASGAVNRGIAAGRVFVSLERNMNCAVGLCGHCQFGSEFVCKDGPVFPFDRVRRLMHVENI
ncbi:MAG: Ni/Fe hydrogenase subunit gamma [Planctomycetaceae bacterium]|nr:Ni/Fe hydrogenase subunit gamma [Planctomycetaceae bacterium]